MLILDIFAQHAKSRDGKLQVELAQLKYTLPRLQEKNTMMSRLTGGIGGRGPGETKLEINRRRAKEKMQLLEKEIEQLATRRGERRSRRTKSELPIVAIVGYTNAGKSTLLNTLTQGDVLAEDKLFATLDPTSRRLRFPSEREIILTDTVGFIRDLPKDLLAAFRATFEEAADADLIVHVVDAADEAHADHIETTEALLAELGLGEIPRVLVFNKSELLAPIERALLARRTPDAVLLSAMDRPSTRPLIERIASQLAERWDESARVPPVPLTEADLELAALESGEESGGSDAVDGEAGEPPVVDASTLDELLRAAGRRPRPPKPAAARVR
jgi:GTP-binding protein HflX